MLPFDFGGRVRPETALEWSQTMTADDLQEIVASEKSRADAQFWPFISHLLIALVLGACVFLTGPLGIDKPWGLVPLLIAMFPLARGCSLVQREYDRTATAAHALKIQQAVPKRSAPDAE